jgi:hypothetical protein
LTGSIARAPIAKMGKGKYTVIDTASVKTKSDKTVAAMKGVLQKAANSMHPCTVVWLGETHRNAVDQGVTRAIFADPPVVREHNTWAFFERGLEDTYVPGPAFGRAGGGLLANTAVEIQAAVGAVARSKNIADGIQAIFDEHQAGSQKVIVYVPCGDAHAEEVFKAMDKRMTKDFNFYHKKTSV